MNERPSHETGPRRRFLRWLGGGLALVFGLEITWLVGSFLRPRGGTDRRERDLFVVGHLDEFEPGTVTAFPEGKFYLSRLDDGGFLALHRECTHLGCTLPWSANDGRFVCPCHRSTFDECGRVLGPPATRPLDTLAVRVEHGMVKVDLSRRTRRVAHHASQVTRP